MDPKKILNKYVKLISWGVLSIYGVACLYLFYMQSIQPLDYNNRYFQSDLPYHISMIIDDGWYYSFTAYAYQLLYMLFGKTTIGIVLFLVAMAVLSIVLTEKLLRVFFDKKEMTAVTFWGAFTLNMVMPFFMRAAGMYRYVSYQAGNIWHNSTYQCMKVFALAAVLCYLQIEKEYREHISTKRWLAFAGILIICTGIKPSFLTVFAPAMALKLLWDLFHKVSFKQIFIFGCAVLPACGVVLWQNAVLFGEETGQGFSLQPWFTFSLHADRPKLAVLCSIAFPLAVVVCSLKELFTDRKYFFGWMMTGIGFLEALLLAETGSRANDGNFLWGYSFAIFYIFVLSFVKWVQMWKKGHGSAACEKSADSNTGCVKSANSSFASADSSVACKKSADSNTGCVKSADSSVAYEKSADSSFATQKDRRTLWYKICFWGCGAVFAYQLYCGIVFFVRLMMGETYFMVL